MFKCLAAVALAGSGLVAAGVAQAESKSPIFGQAAVEVTTPSENKAVKGKATTADYYAYYGNYYTTYALYYGTLASYYNNYGYYYNAYQDASMAAGYYYTAYQNGGTGISFRP